MLKYISTLFWGTKGAVSEVALTLDEAYNIIDDPNGEEEALEAGEEPSEPDECIQDYEVCHKVGTISKIINNSYEIDSIYEYESDTDNLRVGTKISYQVIKSDGDIKIINVEVLENDWNVAETGKKSWHVRTVICTVVQRTGRILTLNPGDICVDLNVVSSEFIPLIGDWLEVEAKCEIDENVVDLSGKILEINKLHPLRAQMKIGKIAQWNSEQNEGIMDRMIFFNRDSLYCGYVPVVGDRVVAEIIESNQGRCAWRAVKIIPDYLHDKSSRKNIDSLDEKKFTDSVKGLSITENIILNFDKLGQKKSFIMEIDNNTPKNLKLICLEFPNLNGQCRVSKEIDHVEVASDQSITVQCECQAKLAGESLEVLIFHFETFKMRRWIQINSNIRAPSNAKPYTKTQKEFVTRTKRELIRGQKIKLPARFLPVRIPDYTLPERILNLITKYHNEVNLAELKQELEKMRPSLITPLNYMNYEDKFHGLLHLDEAHTVLAMQSYDQERACFIQSGEYLLLEIENLAERRPSVIPGDRVIARLIHDTNGPDYEGYIHKLGKKHVYVKFSQIFHDSYKGDDYSVYLIASRTVYRREHHAVNLAIRNLGKEWLFPSKVTEKESQIEFIFDTYFDHLNRSNGSDKRESNRIKNGRVSDQNGKGEEDGEAVPISKLQWYNTTLNYYQKEAVRNALMGVCRPLPYLVFGPPGTGKTVTLVEIVLQILRLMPHARILVAAPSNSAADLLAIRLIDSGVLKPGDLIRLVAITAVGSIPAKLAPYCATANVEREGTETCQPVVTNNGLVLGYSSTVLGRHRITVSTCSSAGLLYNMGFPKGHFSHIIVDEAGQTSEPTVLIPFAFLDLSSGQAIMAGDPMQLGPVILSTLASHYGLEESLLERLINRFPYQRDPEGFPHSHGYDPRLITKLIYNYRSLPDLLKLPSVLFYSDDLIPTISAEDSKEAAILHRVKESLPLRKDGSVAPMVFHSVIGENYQTEDSPSWFNPNEAAQVFFYVNELFRLGLSGSDIGVITPYKAQIKQLTEIFKEAEFELPKIGTVEEFQGQEFNVIVLSTVRSNTKHVRSDIKHSLGFISSPRRLNVSITRAKALLIIVGNADLLATDRCWRSVISYCIENGSFVGNRPKSM